MTSVSSPYPDTRKSTVIIVAICVHALLGYLLFCLPSTQQAFETATVIMAEESPTIQTSLTPQKEDPEWGEMLARQGNFGIPTATPTQSPQQEESDGQARQEAKNPSPAPALVQKNDLEVAPDTQEPTTLGTTAPEQKNTDQSESSNNDESEQQASHQPRPKQRALTLADIGQGFLAQTKHHGTYGVTMEGKKGGHVTDEQIKVERYVERLTWCLQNSLRLQRSNIQPLVHTEMSVYVFLELERSGAIRRVELIRSCGEPRLDKLTLDVFKDAGGAFPPVPAYLTITPFAINYHVEFGTTSEKPLHLSFSR